VTNSGPLPVFTSWVPDYLHGSLRHWQAPRRHSAASAGAAIR
jgi:hypothetical protein